VDGLGFVGEDAGAIGDLLELVIRTVVVEALGDATSVEVAVEVAAMAAQIGEAGINTRPWGSGRLDSVCRGRSA